MNRRNMICAGALGAFSGTLGPASASPTLSETLKDLTQRLVDAIAAGRGDLWAACLHQQFVLTDENGAVSDRAEFLGSLKPLPRGVTGQLVLRDFVLREIGDTAVATYMLDEREQFHGEELRCQYRNTDTWVRGSSAWLLLASQEIALRADPPQMELSLTQWDEYVGRYQLPDQLELQIAREGRQVVVQQTGAPARPLRAELRDLLFSPGQPRYRYVVQRGNADEIVAIRERREAWDLTWRRVA